MSDLNAENPVTELGLEKFDGKPFETIGSLSDKESLELEQNEPRAVVYMLHGFDLTKNHTPGSAFQPAVDYVISALRNTGARVLSPRYNTHESHFRAGALIAEEHRRYRVPTNNIHYFGYSMGGLVARQMVCQGLPPRSLTTVATPNEGVAAWVPIRIPFNNGASSMVPIHNDMNVLNNHPTDIAARRHYTTYSFWYSDGFNVKHDNDGMLEAPSGNMLGQRTKAEWNFKILYSQGRSYLPLSPHGDIQGMHALGNILKRFLSEQVLPTLR